MTWCGYCGHDVSNPCVEDRQAEACWNLPGKTVSNTRLEASRSERQEDSSTTSPSYYSRWASSPIDFIQDNDLSYAEANVIKYIMRHDAKNGEEDLDKALTYIEMIRHRDYK